MKHDHAHLMDLLIKSATETLEHMAFTEIIPKSNASLTHSRENYHGAKISLGELGTLHLFIDQNFLQELTCMLFNLDNVEKEDPNLSDAMQEILNIIAGSFLTEIVQNESDFSLGLPISDTDVLTWESSEVRCLLETDGCKELALGLNSR